MSGEAADASPAPATSGRDADNGDERPTPEQRRWALLAAELPYGQLDIARRQAEGWRNALGASTGIIAAVSLVRGRQDFSPLAAAWKIGIVAGLAAAFAALMSAFLIAVRAAHGRPGLTIEGDGDALRDYVAAESRRVPRLTMLAAYLTVAGVTLILATAVVAWLAPARAR